MSGARRTEDFNTVKTRQLILVNPDGSFPAQGQLIGVTDSRGTLGPTPNPVFGHLSADTLTLNTPITQNIVNATTVNADTINTNIINVNDGRLTVYDLCANRIETVYLTAADISADCIHVDTIFPRQIGTAIHQADVINVAQVNAVDINATISITTPQLTVTSQLDAQDISANYIDAERITTNDLAANIISRAETINAIALTALTADINTLTIGDTATIPILVATDLSATNFEAVDATVTGTLISSGTLNSASINTSGTITADRIRANDISTNSIYADDATFASLRVTTANIDISGLSYPTLDADILTGNTITARVNLISSGTTNMNTATANTLSVSGATTLQGVTATQITAPVINSTNTLIVGTSAQGTTSQITMYDTKLSSAGRTPNPGLLTYDVSDGLLLNGLLVSTTAAFGRTQPFSLVTATNNLATVVDISATMFDLINSYNAFLTLFSNAKLMIQLTPVVNFLSPCSIQFVIGGATRPPLILFGKYTLGATNAGTTTLMTILTQAALGAIQFTATPDANNNWRVTIRNNTATNNFITDITGLPTGSLQVLRYLGFTVPINANPFETYDLSGSIYTRTSTPLSASYDSSGAIVSQLIQYTNNLPDVLYNVTPDPYSLPITFTNLSNNPSVPYLAIKYNGVYTLYSNTNSFIRFSGLAPNTGYPFIFNYLDLSNNSSASPTLTTTRIPAPSDVSANSGDISFNAFTLRWSQPYSGKVYTFTLDASGQNITSPLIGRSSPVTFYPLVQNTVYRVTVTSFDTAFNSFSNPSPPITVTTKSLTVPTPIISAVPRSNITALVNWTTPVTAGASGKLEYYVNSGALRVYNIPSAATSFTITDLSGAGDISGSLVYTDNIYNTTRGAQATYRYDTSFGFFDMSAIDMSSTSVIILNNTTLTGVGYVLPNLISPIVQNPWVIFTFNRISFPQGIRETTGNAVSFRANVYSIIDPANIAGLYSGPSYTATVDLSNNRPTGYGPPLTVSSTFLLDASSTRFPTLILATPVIFATNIIVLFEIVSGTGTIRFSTFLNSPTIAKNAYATSVAYNKSNKQLVNWSVNTLKSVICQFSYV